MDSSISQLNGKVLFNKEPGGLFKYLDEQSLGRIAVSNLLANVIGLHDKDYCVYPGSEYGEDFVKSQDDSIRVLIKSARGNVANCTSPGRKTRTFAFESPKQAGVQQGLFIGVGLVVPSGAKADYGKRLAELEQEYAAAGRVFAPNAHPADPEYLAQCCFYIRPVSELGNSQLRRSVLPPGHRKLPEFAAWGDDPERCRAIWHTAIEQIHGAQAA